MGSTRRKRRPRRKKMADNTSNTCRESQNMELTRGDELEEDLVADNPQPNQILANPDIPTNITVRRGNEFQNPEFKDPRIELLGATSQVNPLGTKPKVRPPVAPTFGSTDPFLDRIESFLGDLKQLRLQQNAIQAEVDSIQVAQINMKEEIGEMIEEKIDQALGSKFESLENKISQIKIQNLNDQTMGAPQQTPIPHTQSTPHKMWDNTMWAPTQGYVPPFPFPPPPVTQHTFQIVPPANGNEGYQARSIARPTPNLKNQRPSTIPTNTFQNTTQFESQHAKKLGKFRTFSGETDEKFQIYLKQFERKLHILNVPEPLYVDYLIDSLSGKAAEFAFNLPNLGNISFKELSDKLEMRFDKLEDPSLFMSRLHVYVQGSEQTPEAFAEEIRVLAQGALVNATQEVIESVAINQFFKGASNKAAALTASAKLPTTLDNALLEFNRALVQQQNILGTSSVRRLSPYSRYSAKDTESRSRESKRKDFKSLPMGGRFKSDHSNSPDRSSRRKRYDFSDEEDSRQRGRYRTDRYSSRSPSTDRRSIDRNDSYRSYNRYYRSSRSPQSYGYRDRSPSVSPQRYGGNRRSISPYKRKFRERDDLSEVEKLVEQLKNALKDQNRKKDLRCFECGSKDHFKAECPRLNESNSKSVDFKLPNEEGSG